MGEEWVPLDPVSHSKPVLFSAHWGCDDLLCLVEELLVCTFFEGFDIVGLFSIKVCKWDMIYASGGVTDHVDFAEVTGTEALVTLHLYNLCDG